MSEPTDLDRYRQLRTRTDRTTVVVGLTEDSVHIEVGGAGAELSPLDALRLSNHLKRLAKELVRRRVDLLVDLPGGES